MKSNRRGGAWQNRANRQEDRMVAPSSAPPASSISFDEFQYVDIRVGTVADAKPFPEAQKPAIRLWPALRPPP